MKDEWYSKHLYISSYQVNNMFSKVSLSIHNSLSVHGLLNSILVALTAISTVFDSSIRDGWVTHNYLIHEDSTYFKKQGLASGSLHILCEDASWEAVVGSISKLYDFHRIVELEHTEDRSEQFFVIGWLVFVDILKDHWIEEVTIV